MSAMDTDTATMAIELSDLDEEEIQADVIHKLAAELVPQFAVQVLKGNAFSERNKSHIRTALLHQQRPRRRTDGQDHDGPHGTEAPRTDSGAGLPTCGQPQRGVGSRRPIRAGSVRAVSLGGSKVWALSHKAWNALMHALHGNTTTAAAAAAAAAAALTVGSRVAVWWREDNPQDERWYTGKIKQSSKTSPTVHEIEYDGDGSRQIHDFADDLTWVKGPPAFTPTCPACNTAMAGGTGSHGPAKSYSYEPHKQKVSRKRYTCESCLKVVTCKNPDVLERADPTGARITEDPDVQEVQPKPPRAAAVRQQAVGGTARRSPRLAANGAAATPPPPKQQKPSTPPKPGAQAYRHDVDPHVYVADTTLAYHNANGLCAPGAARAYLRDVALPLADVALISETGWNEAQCKHLREAMEERGHRLWTATPATRGNKGTGTAVLAKSTVTAQPGDGLIYAKADGKALAVALTVVGTPVILLAAHLPHTDDDREAFLLELAADLPAAVDSQISKVDDSNRPIGLKWARAIKLWAGDLNMTMNRTIDNEQPHAAPSPGVMTALQKLDDLMGNAVDAYRTMHPLGGEFTHGRPEKKNQRRIDMWRAQGDQLSGASGAVATRTVSRETAGFSYVNAHTRKECYKQSDHDMIQLTLRLTQIRREKPEPAIRQGTLRHPEVMRAVEALIEEATATQRGASAGSSQQHAADAMTGLHAKTLEACVKHQRAQAKERGKRRTNTLTRIRRLQQRVAHQGVGDARQRSERNLARYRAKLQKMDHAARRARDTQEAYEAQMTAAGQGRAAKVVTRPLPVTRVTIQSSDGGPPEEHTAQADMLAAASGFWKRLLNMQHTPSEEAKRDAESVLARIKTETEGMLPDYIVGALSAENIISKDNIKAAVRDLARGSTPGVDRMPLEFYLLHLDRLAPLLHKLYKQVLERGEMTPEMAKAVLSPIYKNKGSTSDQAMYRPISVTTIAYRILAKCIAQRLNKAVRWLIGETQVGFCPGRNLDENVNLVRQVVHDVNHNRQDAGGMLLMLDNTKAFDRLQHGFMFDTLAAFNLPKGLIDAVRTLYNGAQTKVKLNGVTGSEFENTSGVRQGCPLSPLLYVLVQEVQLRMIRDDPAIAGITIPDPDGNAPPVATRVGQPRASELRERGLVDDTMVAVRSPEAIPPLLHVLDRFEAMSNHRMNLSKTVLLLLGKHRDFDVNGDTAAAVALRGRGLKRAYDITPGQGDLLPEKWHGVLLGNETGLAKVWEETAKEAGATAATLQASSMPHGSRGRLTVAQGKVMGKALAPLRLTAPHDEATVDRLLGEIQKHANRLVFGSRNWLKREAAQQPRECMGVGHLHVKRYMRAAWLKPLLSAMGQDAEQRPYKNYFAHYARKAYPALDMGRELLTLNLSFRRVASLPLEAITGEAKQAFMGLGAMPPLLYHEPEEGSPAAPREEMAYETLAWMPLMLNPVLEATPMAKRATDDEEAEVLRWAANGITRVFHVLDASGTRLATLAELLAAHPALVDASYPRGRATAAYRRVQQNLQQWTETLSKGRPQLVQQGQFRWGPDGKVLRAERDAEVGDTTVPATIYVEQPHAGLVASTNEKTTLPARVADSAACPVICVQCSDDETSDSEDDDSGAGSDSEHSGGTPDYTGGGTPDDVEVAHCSRYRHVVLAPWAAPPTPDPRQLSWLKPATMQPAAQVQLVSAGAKEVRLTLTAQDYTEPRVFEGADARYAALVAGLTGEARRRRLAAIAEGLSHWAIPQEESHHLRVTMHHGHLQASRKCEGDKALCARCLQRNARHEESAIHEYHDCPAIREGVWKPLASAWLEATGDAIDIESPLLTVAGLRLAPATLTGDARKRFDAREPAWRLLHSAALLQVHRARTRLHMAYHAQPRHDARRAASKDILRAINQRVAERVRFEHAKAKHAAAYAGDHEALKRFRRTWVVTGVAVERKGVACLALFSKQPTEAGVEAGEVHIRLAAAHKPASGKRAPASGWALTAHDVAADGSEQLRLRAEGAIPATATHGSEATACSPRAHTVQAAEHMAALAALTYARQLAQRGRSSRISVSSASVLRSVRETPTRPSRLRKAGFAKAAQRCREVIAHVENDYVAKIRFADGGAVPLGLLAEAEKAAFLKDVKAHVTAKHVRRAVSLWDESRVWDPGD